MSCVFKLSTQWHVCFHRGYGRTFLMWFPKRLNRDVLSCNSSLLGMYSVERQFRKWLQTPSPTVALLLVAETLWSQQRKLEEHPTHGGSIHVGWFALLSLSPLPPCSASRLALVRWQNLFCDHRVGLDHISVGKNKTGKKYFHLKFRSEHQM